MLGQKRAVFFSKFVEIRIVQEMPNYTGRRTFTGLPMSYYLPHLPESGPVEVFENTYLLKPERPFKGFLL